MNDIKVDGLSSNLFGAKLRIPNYALTIDASYINKLMSTLDAATRMKLQDEWELYVKEISIDFNKTLNILLDAYQLKMQEKQTEIIDNSTI